MFSDKWMWWAWFGALILVGCEIIFWRSPLDRSGLEALRLIVGYVAIGAVTLDLLVRYRVRDLAGVLGTVLCIAPMIALILTRENSLGNLPHHLFSRVLGLHTIGLLWALGVWFGLWNRGYSVRWFGVGSVLFGVMIALWVRSADDFINWSLSSPTLIETLVIYGLIGVLIGAGGYLAKHYPLKSSDDLLMSSTEWGVMIVLGVGLMLWDVAPNRQAFSGTVILSSLGALMIWFENNAKSYPLMAHLLAQNPPDLRRVMALWLMAGIGLAFGWMLPLGMGTSPALIGILEIAIVLFGFSWMPLLMLWVGVRALSRRSLRLDIE